MGTKICTKCGAEKELKEFARHNRRNQTHYSHCKQCKAEYRKANKDKLLPAQYKRRVGNQKDCPQRKAWNALFYAVKMGKIEKPENCSMCDKYVGDKIQGHHEDYSKPFAVQWVCQDCHVIVDKLRQVI